MITGSLFFLSFFELLKADLTYNISFYAKTEGENTTPARDGEKIQVVTQITQGCAGLYSRFRK